MGWGKGGKGWAPGPFGHHHHHHRGPGVGVAIAEAAVVGAVAGATIATVAATSHPRPRPKPKPRPYYCGPDVIVVEPGRPIVQAQPVVAQAQPVVVVCPKAKPFPKHKGKGRGKGPIVVVDNTPPLNISSISMRLPAAEIRGISYFYAVHVTPETGAAWRIMRSYKEFEDLYCKIGRQSFPACPFPQSLEKMASGDRRYDFGMGLGTCVNCKAKCKNRGDKETRTVYCSDCYPQRFPDPAVLQTQHNQLELWLKSVVGHGSSQGPWKVALKGFLEAGREFISAAPAQSSAVSSAKAPAPTPQQAAYTQPSPPTAPETALEQHDEKGEMMSIEIPAGLKAGQVIAINVPDGKQVQLTVPEGHQGGDTLSLWYDSVAGTLTPVDDSPEQSGSDQTLSISVPAGVSSGQLIAITVPDGRQIHFTVPEGKNSGDQLDLWFDSAAGTLTPLL